MRICRGKGQKVLYFCPVDWRWIKQRPQFLAEQLQRYCDLEVIYPWRNRRRGLQRNTSPKVKLRPYFILPELGGRVPFLKRFNRIASKAQIAWVLKKASPDILCLTMPWQIDLLPEGLHCQIVYDCMDDYAAIDMRQEQRENILRQEKTITDLAQTIFVSSAHLQNLLMTRYSLPEERLCLLRNGYSSGWTKVSGGESAAGPALRMAYFGTIGRWFDFDMLLQSLDAFADLEYHLFGPTEWGVCIPDHPRLIAHGVVEHDKIPAKAAVMDGLIMPFVPNTIVQSVDPVKLYEYIFLDKPILCIYYPEIARFEKFVEFYETKEQFNAAMERLFSNREPKFSQQQAACFLEKNSWDVRGKCAAERLGLTMKEK